MNIERAVLVLLPLRPLPRRKEAREGGAAPPRGVLDAALAQKAAKDSSPFNPLG